MFTWKKIRDLFITDDLVLGKNAKVSAFNRAGNLVQVGIGATETLTATTTLTDADNGKTFFLSSSTEFATTLPAPKAGFWCQFIVAAAPSGASYTVVTNGSSNIIKGQVVSSDLNAANDADFETSGGDTITFADGVAVASDRVEIYCDGTNYFAYGYCTAYNGITITTAS